jgi:uncharacterized membrane protein required for colicin V production
MIVAAAYFASSVANNLSVSWFDGVFLVVLGFGLFRGRHNGLSRELLPMLQWILLVFTCGLGYPSVAQWCITYLKWSRTISDIAGYVALALVILMCFAFLKERFTERLVKFDAFKSGEYYLGMPAGMIRFASILLVPLALLNAPVYTSAEIAAEKAYEQQNYGGGEKGFSGNFFPSIPDIQSSVFVQSITGRFVKKNIGMLLIDTSRLDVIHKIPPPRTGNY